MLPPGFFDHPVVEVAQALIGATLLVDGVGGAIVETEAYDRSDPASHSFGGQTARNAAMFGPSGRAYVYRSYGLHWCLNLVCGDPGSAVLIRALEPRVGLDRMRARRGLQASPLLCSGPGKLCQALGIDRSFDGLPVSESPFALSGPEAGSAVMTGRRIGISKGVEAPWRYGLAGSRHLSRPFPGGRGDAQTPGSAIT